MEVVLVVLAVVVGLVAVVAAGVGADTSMLPLAVTWTVSSPPTLTLPPVVPVASSLDVLASRMF